MATERIPPVKAESSNPGCQSAAAGADERWQNACRASGILCDDKGYVGHPKENVILSRCVAGD